VTVQQAIQHAGTGWFADGRGNSADLRVQIFDIHICMLSEVLM
jgi:hypothetical protein